MFARTRGGAPRDPARMRRLLDALALTSPETVVHIVGTNGKGTVTAMVAAGLQATGLRTGRFLSPHVEEFRERVAVDGAAVTRDSVRRFVRRARRAQVEEPPAFFEWTLAFALDAWRRRGVAAAAVEAGVGGASDATRALDNVRVVVLTNVTLEHQAVLGPELADIARDKAGAARPGVPLVTGAVGEALAVVLEVARTVGAPVYVDRDGSPLFEPATALPPGVPPTRERNARLATAALRLLGAPPAALALAPLAPALPARGEAFMLRGRTVVLDGAHDPAAAALLAGSMTPGYVLLFGALARKQGAATLAALSARAAAVVLTEAVPGDGVPEPGPATPTTAVERDPAAALARALSLAPDDGVVLAAGSLYLAGRLRPLLRARGIPCPFPSAPPGADGGRPG